MAVTFPIEPEILVGQVQNSSQILKMWMDKLDVVRKAGFQFADEAHYESFVSQMSAELTIVTQMLETLVSVVQE